MVRKTLLGALAGALLVGWAFAQAPAQPAAPAASAAPTPAAAAPAAKDDKTSVDDLIAKNLAARGGADKIKAVKSAKLTGKMMMGPGMEAPFVWEWKRPNSFRTEFVFQGMTGIQAYDGTTGWSVMPFLGKKDPEKMSEEEMKDIDEQADFDGPFVDSKEKGVTVEYLGKEPIEGTDAYKLKVTRKNGDVTNVYLDAESYLEIKSTGKRTRRGQEFEFEASQGDYKKVGDVLFAHSMEFKPKGAPAGQTMTIEKIELNTEESADRFKMPEVKKEEPPAKPGK